jgi:murein DD-endopeptidase MepM/ murein hydrolase activator NlpD
MHHRATKQSFSSKAGRFLPAAVVAFAAVFGLITAASGADVRPVPRIEATQGLVVRWSLPGTKRCGMGRKSWPSLQETCYYPIDLSEKPGVITISRRGVGPAELARISVELASYGSEEIALGDIPQANPKPRDLQRNARDQVVMGKVWGRREGLARFTLPLGAPASPLSEGKGFGARWIFNGKPESGELHTGADFALTTGTPVLAVADGTVVVAEDLFIPGNAVFIDHGDGLISMYFHFSEIKVKSGQEVKKGEVVGLVGETGRASGPHLHLGIRWHGARINPQLLLGDPAKIPAVGP